MTFKLKEFHFSKKFKTLAVSSELFGGLFPPTINIESNFSGEVIQFIPDQKMNEDAEWSDGVQLFYKPTTPLKNVKYLTVYHVK